MAKQGLYSSTKLREINIIGNRICELRTKEGWSQAEFCDKLRDVMDSTESLRPVSISAYEQGRRVPPIQTLIGIAKLFHVSLDYITGVKDEVEIEMDDHNSTQDVFHKSGQVMRPQEYAKFDGTPVFVQFEDGEAEARWGIMDYRHNRVVFNDSACTITPRIKILKYKPIYTTTLTSRKIVPLNMGGVMRCPNVWVESFSSDKTTIGKYTGYYKHNEDRTCLINITNGLTLPYTGLGISYNAFKIDD